MDDHLDTDAIRKIHRKPEFGDYDAGQDTCHHCVSDGWPCDAILLADEVDFWRKEAKRLQQLAQALNT